MLEELWKPVLGYEDVYEVSSFGRLKTRYVLRRATNNILKPYLASAKNGCKYYQYCLYDGRGGKRKILMHILVAKHFVPNPNNLPEVNHIDLDKLNCKWSNLEWVTHKGNAAHATKAGVYNAKTNPKRIKKLSEDAVQLMRLEVKKGRKRSDVAKEFNVHRSYVDMVMRGERRV